MLPALSPAARDVGLTIGGQAGSPARSILCRSLQGPVLHGEGTTGPGCLCDRSLYWEGQSS